MKKGYASFKIFHNDIFPNDIYIDLESFGSEETTSTQGL